MTEKMNLKIKINDNGKLIDAVVETKDGVMIVSPIEKPNRFRPLEVKIYIPHNADEISALDFNQKVADGRIFFDKKECEYICDVMNEWNDEREH